MSATPAGSVFASNIWHLMNAKEQVVGRLASKIAMMLQGKHKPTFQRNAPLCDNIVVINAAKVV